MIGIPNPKRSSTKQLENDTEIEVREARRRAIRYPANRRRVATKPINMPGGGASRRGGEAGHAARKVGGDAVNKISSSARKTARDVENALMERAKQAIFGNF